MASSSVRPTSMGITEAVRILSDGARHFSIDSVIEEMADLWWLSAWIAIDVGRPRLTGYRLNYRIVILLRFVISRDNRTTDPAIWEARCRSRPSSPIEQENGL